MKTKLPFINLQAEILKAKILLAQKECREAIKELKTPRK